MKRGAKHMTSSANRPTPISNAPRGSANAAARAAHASSDAPAAAGGGGGAGHSFNPFAANRGAKKTTGGSTDRTRAGQGFVFSQCNQHEQRT
jgi:hypothetical protein